MDMLVLRAWEMAAWTRLTSVWSTSQGPYELVWTGLGSPSSSASASASASAIVKVPGIAPPVPGMFPNMFQMPTGQQFGAMPIMSVQAMTQQATRHARRVYVGGLPPSANEQSVATYFSHVIAAIGGNTAGPGNAVVCARAHIRVDECFEVSESQVCE
ncbi:hypothetical protein ACFE04_017162 [Oxalis oulophora]